MPLDEAGGEQGQEKAASRLERRATVGRAPDRPVPGTGRAEALLRAARQESDRRGGPERRRGGRARGTGIDQNF